MKRLILWSHNIGSNGCKVLSNSIPPEYRAKRVRTEGTYRPFPNHTIVNWGNGTTAPWINPATQVINKPTSVAQARHKLKAFEKLGQMEVSIPQYYTRKQDAFDAHTNDKKVYCRTKLQASGGEGIVVAHVREELVDAPLYTVGIDIRREYRVHVFNRKVIDVVQKRRRVVDGQPDPNADTLVRNHTNGWVFVHENFEVPQEVKDEAIKAINALDLDFGAVDIITEKRTGKVYVLETNTAPGLENTKTIDAYVNALKEVLV